jgi:hypothetical protein
MKTLKTFSCAVLMVFALACGGDDDDDAGGDDDGGDDEVAEGCGGMCMEAGFDEGEEMDFDPVFECVCSGGTAELTEAACDAYCEDSHGVSAANALLSMQTTANDKCVCDGTAE